MNAVTANCIDSFEVKRMKLRGTARGLFAVLGMILMILDTDTALKGANEGIASCIGTVIPSLLPFLLLSSLLNGSIASDGGRMPDRLLRVAGLPKGTGHILVSAVLGGYPAGAQAVYDTYSHGSIPKKDAQLLLAYTNNAGPAFIFGLVGHMFSSVSAAWFLWGIHLISAFLVRLTVGPSVYAPARVRNEIKRPGASVISTAKTMCTICIWVIAFKIITAYLHAWTNAWVPPIVRTMIFGSLELVNGCCTLQELRDIRIRFITCSAILAFGGLCVLMQTATIVRELGTGHYLLGKILQTVFSIAISSALIFGKWHFWAAATAPVAYFLLRMKNKGGNQATISV